MIARVHLRRCFAHRTTYKNHHFGGYTSDISIAKHIVNTHVAGFRLVARTLVASPFSGSCSVWLSEINTKTVWLLIDSSRIQTFIYAVKLPPTVSVCGLWDPPPIGRLLV